MQLKDVVEQSDGTMSGWVTYKPGFDIEVEHVPRKSAEEIRRRCMRRVYGRDHQPVDELDEVKFRAELCKKIKGWRGLDGGMLRKIFPIKAGVELNGEAVPCDDDNKAFMLENAYNFDNFIFNAITDIELLRAEQAGKEKKTSATSSPGS